jgi:hypothetical protein
VRVSRRPIARNRLPLARDRSERVIQSPILAPGPGPGTTTAHIHEAKGARSAWGAQSAVSRTRVAIYMLDSYCTSQKVALFKSPCRRTSRAARSAPPDTPGDGVAIAAAQGANRAHSRGCLTAGVRRSPPASGPRDREAPSGNSFPTDRLARARARAELRGRPRARRLPPGPLHAAGHARASHRRSEQRARARPRDDGGRSTDCTGAEPDIRPPRSGARGAVSRSRPPHAAGTMCIADARALFALGHPHRGSVCSPCRRARPARDRLCRSAAGTAMRWQRGARRGWSPARAATRSAPPRRGWRSSRRARIRTRPR